MKANDRAKIFYEIIQEYFASKNIDDLPINDLPIKETFSFRCSLSEETDRGCALMAAAFLDYELRILLEATFVENERLSKTLFENNGPLSNFSSRIDIAYMMGLISDFARRDLHLLRKIRNEFAHTHENVKFEQENISNRCSELKLKNLQDDAKPRHKFTNSMMAVAGEIHTAIFNAKRIEQRRNVDLAKFVKLSEELSAEVIKKFNKEIQTES